VRRFAASTLAVLATMLTTAFGAGEVVDRVSRAVALPPAAAIRVDATIAELTITAAERHDVQIEIERRAPARADLARFPVEVEPGGQALHVSVVQPDDRRDPRLKSTIVITAPVAAVFPWVRVFEGHVRLENVHSAADVDIRRGVIDATRMAGRVRLESGIGGIDVRDSELTQDGMMRLRVFNGPLHVRFGHRPPNARILAVTLNGGITSDIPLTMKDRFGPRFGETTIGSGDPVLSMDVVKGDITVAVGR
jgi:hypothetical protein